jgi:hypothetical protein
MGFVFFGLLRVIVSQMAPLQMIKNFTPKFHSTTVIKVMAKILNRVVTVVVKVTEVFVVVFRDHPILLEARNGKSQMNHTHALIKNQN